MSSVCYSRKFIPWKYAGVIEDERYVALLLLFVVVVVFLVSPQERPSTQSDLASGLDRLPLPPHGFFRCSYSVPLSAIPRTPPRDTTGTALSFFTSSLHTTYAVFRPCFVPALLSSLLPARWRPALACGGR